VKSAATLAAGDKGAIADIAALEQTLAASEPIDASRVKIAYRSTAARLKVRPAEIPAMTDAEKTAAKLFPVRKPGTPAQPQGFGGGGGAQANAGQAAPPPALAGYYAMEARNFADGQHSLLDVRNALAAEFGPVPVDAVTKFFRDLEKTGAYAIREKK
jgi:hypothetical protein